MRYYQVNPAKVEALKQQIDDLGWALIFQDAGQNHFVGWGYIMQWQKVQSTLTLHYSEKQGVADARIEWHAPETSSETLQGIQEYLYE